MQHHANPCSMHEQRLGTRSHFHKQILLLLMLLHGRASKFVKSLLEDTVVHLKFFIHKSKVCSIKVLDEDFRYTCKTKHSKFRHIALMSPGNSRCNVCQYIAFIYQVLHCTMRQELAMQLQIPETQLSFFGYTYRHELGTCGELGSLLARAC
jgi:hypothetical protein